MDLNPFVILLVWLCSVNIGDAASFYGDSFISLPFQDDSDTTQLQLRFRTSLSNGLLFLASGTTDYLAVTLKDGMLLVVIDVGSGTISLQSVKNNKLNDRNWHQIKFQQKGLGFTLNIDNDEIIRTKGTGALTQLNIQNGIFLGGIPSDSINPTSRPLDSFRGCLQNVLFNQYNIINLAHKLQDSKSRHHVTWNCEDEFGADTSDEINFSTERSYAALPSWYLRSNGGLTLELKTHQENALLLFISSNSEENPHTIAIELISKKLKLTVNRGGSTLSINSHVTISDGSWHLLQAVFFDDRFMFGVDGERQQSRYDSKSQRYFQLESLLFVGGVVGLHDASYVAEALKIQSSQTSFKGCVKNILIDNKAFGFPDIQRSNGLGVGCTIQSSCMSNPCLEGAECIDKNNGYDCICRSAGCLHVVEEAPEGNYTSGNDEDLQLVLIHPLSAKEGKQVIVTTDNIEVVFDYKKYGIRESAIQFYVLEKPKLGSFRVDLGRRRNSDVFTLLDLIGNKVSYTHNGIEEFSDSVSIEMMIIGIDKDIPKRLTQKYAFLLPIVVYPVNDPPILRAENLINMAKSSAIEITSDIVTVIDPDSEFKDIVLTAACVIRKYANIFQKKDDPGKSINSFTMQEVKDGKIEFVDKRRTSTKCQLVASDKGEMSNMVTVTFRPIELYLTLTYTARIRVTSGTYTLLKTENLNVKTNIKFQKFQIKYTLTIPPSSGELEMLQSNNEWSPVTEFFQQNIDQSMIRYRHVGTSYSSSVDQFSFIIDSLHTRVQQQTVPVDIIPLTIHVETPKSFKADGAKGYFIVTKSELEGTTNNNEQPPSDIKFQITRAPAQGRLYHLSSNQYSDFMFKDGKVLNKDDIFTQTDVNDGLIAFKLNRKSFDKLNDFMDLRIQVAEAQSKLFRLRFEILPKQTNVKFINIPLTDIYEGGQKAIERNVLYLETTAYKEFEFTVTSFPQHGSLLMVDPRSMAVLQRNISIFTNDDIRSLRLVYEHDDSESQIDSFDFISFPLDKNKNKLIEKTQQYSGTFHIQITMRNDHYPTRLVDKVFRIVANRDRVISLNDLAFEDPDIDFDTMNLVYSQRGVPNGEFIFTQNRSSAYQFKQRDIAEGHISFRHSGTVLHERAIIWVTDGQYYTTSVFEIQASNPYVKVINNTGIFAKKENFAIISSRNLSIETNVDLKPEDIKIVIIEEPLHGKVEMEGREITEFSYQDILDNKVKYRHNSRSGIEDEFHFIVVARDAQVKGSFPIRILTESHQHPPRVVSNNLLEVQELGVVTITKGHLEISHPDSLPSGIKYTVQHQPKHGRLYLDGKREGIVKQFTQEKINKGELKYHHTESGPLSDFFSFDVTNGMQALRNLEFVMEIIPSYLELDIQNLTVKEGGKVPITPAHLKVRNRYYSAKPVRYEILQQPTNGRLETIRKRGESVSSFSSGSVQHGEIFYVHDNSELGDDNFILKALVDDGKKESRMTTVHIKIRSINDKPPVLVTNQKLKVWKGSMGLITAANLKAYDVDSPPEKVRYTITQPTNGHVALLNNTFRSISTFTQSLINAGQVAFVHRGSENGQFNFHVSDGVNSDGRLHRFYITAELLFVSVVKNSELKVYPGKTQAITVNHLFSKTNDPDQIRPIIYNVMSRPLKGRIITRYNGQPLELQSFKQDDIENGLIFYEHNTYDTEWDEKDTFVFEVSSLYAEPVKNQVFRIDISYTNKASGVDFNDKGKLQVKEGGNVTLTRNNIDVTDYIQKLQNVGQRVDVDVLFVLTSMPKHGRLVKDRELSLGQSFKQDNVNKGQIIYEHDGSETTEDSFTVKLEIADHLKSEDDQKIDATLNFSVDITPVNDEKFRLITSNPHLYVIQGLSVDITNSDIKTEDLDTLAEQIIYEITILPKNGIIAFKDNPRKLINKFSQKDIDDGKLQFQHDGKNPSTTFHFRVSDGYFPALSRSCYITVIPISLELINDYHIQLMQSDTTVDIKDKNIAVKTNGQRNNVYYNITSPPRYGAIYSGKSVVLSFKQTDIDDEKIYYIQHDLSSYVDYFICDIFYPGVDPMPVIHNQQINIGVEPLVVQNPFSAPVGEKVAITKRYLDAGKLANLTGHMPQFQIIERPKYGRIIGPRRRKRATNSHTHYIDIFEFSHEDIVHGNVFYAAFNIPYKEGVVDSFGFVLSANTVQPAAGRFNIKLAPPKGYSTPSIVDRGSNDRNDTEKDVKRSEVVEPEVKSDFVIVLAILIPLFILLILVLLAIYFIWRKRRHREYVPPVNESKRLRPSISGPLSLEQPHVHIEPQQEMMLGSDDDVSLNDEHPNYYNLPPPRANRNDEYRLITHSDGKLEVGPKVPQCKVTLLADNLDAESTSRMSGYSVRSDTSTELFEWSSLMDPEILQHCRTTNPVLRDNQYWV